MARNMTDGPGGFQCANDAQANINGTLLSIAFWWKSNDISTGYPLFAGADATWANREWYLFFNTSGGNHRPFLFRKWSGGMVAYGLLNSGDWPSPSTDWRHMIITHDGGDINNDANYYLDGVYKAGANATASGTIETGADTFSVGKRIDTSLYNFRGDMAEVAIYNNIITADKAAAMGGAGYSPAYFPEGRVFYNPLWGDGTDGILNLADGVAYPHVGTTAAKAEHPPILYPAANEIIVPAAAAGNPEYYYSMLRRRKVA